jgi:peptidoglycan/LPS O-acetylase OafA/YrhL
LAKDNNDIFGLNLLRSCAVLMVVFGHLMLYRPSASFISSQLAPLFGFLGVEALLVLGGFLIGKKVYELAVLGSEFSSQNVLRFFKKMAWRFLPLYFLVLLLVLFVAFSFDYPTVDVWKYFGFVQNFSSPMPVFFSESWPITIGFFGSVTLILGMYLTAEKKRFIGKASLFLGFTFLMIALFVGVKYIFYLQNRSLTLLAWDQHLKTLLIYRLDSFYIGVLCAWMYLNRRAFWVAYRKLLLLFGMLLMCLLFVGVGFFGWLIDSRPFFWEVLYLPVTSVSIALFLPFLSSWDLRKSWISATCSFLCKISYPLFLIHYSLLLQVMNQFFSIKDASVGGFLILSTIFMLLGLVMSVVLHRFYEKPLMRFGA